MKSQMEGFLEIIKREILIIGLFLGSLFVCVLKNYVFIKLRKQARQEREGFSACYL